MSITPTTPLPDQSGFGSKGLSRQEGKLLRTELNQLGIDRITSVARQRIEFELAKDGVSNNIEIQKRIEVGRIELAELHEDGRGQIAQHAILSLTITTNTAMALIKAAPEMEHLAMGIVEAQAVGSRVALLGW